MKPKKLKHIRDVPQKHNNKAIELTSRIQESVKESPIVNAVCFIQHENGRTTSIDFSDSWIELLGLIEFGKTMVIEE